jgi:hypothetical protein
MNNKQALGSRFAPVSINGAVRRRAGRMNDFVLGALRRAYDAQMERAQMRLAPTRVRSWREIRRPRSSYYC